MNTPRIVIADPYSSRADCLRSLLLRAGFSGVDLAQPELSALKEQCKTTPDLLILGTSDDFIATELCRQLRFSSIAGAASLPIMVIAPENASIRWTKTARNSGAHAWMPSDFSAGDIVRASQMLLKFAPPIIEAEHYRGPCRRLGTCHDFSGPGRRANEASSPANGPKGVFDTLFMRLVELEDRLNARELSPLFVRRHIMAVSGHAMRLSRDNVRDVFQLWGTTLERHGDMIASNDLREIVSAGIAALDRFAPGNDQRLAIAHLRNLCRKAAREADLAVITVQPRTV
jgi:hypothetical protein